MTRRSLIIKILLYLYLSLLLLPSLQLIFKVTIITISIIIVIIMIINLPLPVVTELDRVDDDTEPARTVLGHAVLVPYSNLAKANLISAKRFGYYNLIVM